MNARQVTRGGSAASRRRLGYTLLEIMTSVTLALMLMYAVARIFSYVGGAMNETMSTMEMNNALRNARNRLTQDLEALSVSPAPPRNSRMNEGYLCYVEGMGGPFNQIVRNGGRPFASSDVALDSDRYAEWVDDGKPAADNDRVSDNTVGDLDDILSFTAKAPDGQVFRGRYVEPIYAVDSASGRKYIADAKISTYESQYAEIVWFVRGTTLFRRVLPIISNEMLQESLRALKYASTCIDEMTNPISRDDDLNGVAWDNIARGFGFYYFYDASIHLGQDGRVVANTLGDLTNRENRYFYWNSYGLHLHPDDSGLNPIVAAPIHGADGSNDAWYWLRMATLQESAAPNFRAGAPFGQNYFARDSFIARKNGSYNGLARTIYGLSNNTTSELCDAFWQGAAQTLTYRYVDTAPINADTTADNLPIIHTPAQPASPFIDFWNAPNVWDEVNYETGDLNQTTADFIANSSANGADKAFNQDVVLTNVISFNVKVWDDTTNAYVDLGACAGNGTIDLYDPNELTSFGRYGNPNNRGTATDDNGSYPLRPWVPCVYDTWSEQYQRDLYVFDDNRMAQHYRNNPGSNWTANATGSMSDVPSDGLIDSSQLKDYPPPYNKRIKSIQVEIRVFDPRSKTVRNNTFNVDLSRI